MAPAFIATPALPLRSAHTLTSTSPRMSAASEVVDKYFPTYRRHRAPVIEVNGDVGVKVSMSFVAAFQEVDKEAGPLLDYSDETEFKSDKPQSPSAISWPSGDGRGKEFKGFPSFYTQPNLKTYGPFPDFFKVVRCLINVRMKLQ